MRNPSHQRGMTLIGLIFVLAIFGFFVLLILKIGPIYLEHFKVVGSLKSLQETPELAKKSRREIRSLLEKRLDINMVENVAPEDIVVRKEGGVVTVEVSYEVEKPVLGNLSVVAYFDDRIEAGGAP